MGTEASTALHYDRRTIRLHWLTALMIGFMWIGAHFIDWFPKGPLRVDARSVHIMVGVALLVVLIVRLRWRFGGGLRLPYAPAPMGTLARIVHAGLYGLILATLTLGMFNAWVRGDSLFGILQIPAYGTLDPAARHAFSESVVRYHGLCANLVLVVAAGHALVALINQFVLRDGTLHRMMPRL